MEVSVDSSLIKLWPQWIEYGPSEGLNILKGIFKKYKICLKTIYPDKLKLKLDVGIYVHVNEISIEIFLKTAMLQVSNVALGPIVC